MSNNLRNEIIRLRQNERRQARRVEINRRRNERDEPRRAEINRRRMERDEPRRAEINRRRIERDEPRRAEINCNQNERNQARRELNRYNMHRIARNNIAIESNYLGELNHNCQYCSAKKFLNETHFLCCHSGKVALAPLSLYPPLLTGLMTGNHVDHAVNQNFFKHIRSYNSSLSFASFTAEITPPSNNGPFCFRVCGQILHRVGNLRPAEGCLPKYCQLYIYDPNAAVSFRMEQPGNDGCIHELMQLLQTLINQENPFALSFKNMAEVEDEEIRQAALEGRPTSVVRISLAAASSVTSSKSWEDFRKYRSQHPGPLSMRAFHRWCLYGDDHPSFRWRDGTPYNTGNRADAGRRRQRGAKVVNNFFTY
nr:uncharacterized protein LOC124810249 isoform X3 [Hydra vulgaris]